MKWHLKLFLYHYTPIITHWQQMRQNLIISGDEQNPLKYLTNLGEI